MSPLCLSHPLGTPSIGGGGHQCVGRGGGGFAGSILLVTVFGKVLNINFATTTSDGYVPMFLSAGLLSIGVAENFFFDNFVCVCQVGLHDPYPRPLRLQAAWRRQG